MQLPYTMPRETPARTHQEDMCTRTTHKGDGADLESISGHGDISEMHARVPCLSVCSTAIVHRTCACCWAYLVSTCWWCAVWQTKHTRMQPNTPTETHVQQRHASTDAQRWPATAHTYAY